MLCLGIFEDVPSISYLSGTFTDFLCRDPSGTTNRSSRLRHTLEKVLEGDGRQLPAASRGS